MDGRRLDNLARMVARSVPRRTVLKGMAGAVGAAAVKLWRGGGARAQVGPAGLPACVDDFDCPGPYGTFNDCCNAVCCGDLEMCSAGNVCVADT